MKKVLVEDKYDEIYSDLDDPVNYFCKQTGIYTLKDLLDQSFIRLNIDEIAEDIVRDDGVDAILDHYDGRSEEIYDPVSDTTFTVYGIN